MANTAAYAWVRDAFAEIAEQYDHLADRAGCAPRTL